MTRPAGEGPKGAKAATSPCPICPKGCRPAEGQPGACGARVARGGAVVSASYGKLTALALDPIEKKPLARFMPGSHILSAGSFGCNLRCPFCQNHDIAQGAGEALVRGEWPPEKLVQRALALRSEGNVGIAFTYNEPGVGFEYVRDTAALARKNGLAGVMVTNGYLCPEPFSELLAVLDALNIDLKCFSEEGYRRLGGALAPVQRNIERAVAAGVHVEITTLVVPGLSDSIADMEAEAAWIAGLSPEIPLHLSRYFPRWQATEPATDPGVLHQLAQVARRRLRHVYLGNI